jgi:sugar/nucleoside kinase (ribokinase family)
MTNDAPSTYDVVAAGHVCVDIIPTFEGPERPLSEILIPGKLTQTGPCITTTGGSVSNTGLALYKLGVPARLMGKVGGDLFGSALIDLLNARDPALTEGMIRAPGEPSSYTMVINPPGVDRVFLHSPGPNDTYGADDVRLDVVAGARLFHFGYPPIMRRMFLDGGRELALLLERVRATGVTVSLDMSYPDPLSEAGRIDWLPVLAGALPFVDLFSPSIDEIVYMLDRPRSNALRAGEAPVDGALLSQTAERLLAYGAAIVLLKLGDQGLYLRTTTDMARLAAAGRAQPQDLQAWAGRELLSTCFQVQVGGTTGSGDSTIAGFITGLLHGLAPEDALTGAVAVGAHSVEAPDASTGIVPWEQVQARIASGWQRHALTLELDGWQPLGPLWTGPHDGRAQ